MLRTLIAATAICALTTGSALALDNGRSDCGWEQGVFVCRSKYETDYATTYTLCASGGYDAACTTKTKEKDPDPPKYSGPAEEFVPTPTWWKGDSKTWHDSRSTSLCPKPYHMTATDGCQR